MADEILNIKESNATSGQSVTLDNTVEDNTIRAYPYILTGVNDLNKFIQPNATSIVSIDNNPDLFDETNILLNTDENGNPFIDILATLDVNKEEFSLNTTSVTGMQRQSISQITMITNRLSKSFAKAHVMYTFGSPFNYDEYVNGNQDVFLINNISVSGPNTNNIAGERSFQESELPFLDMTLINVKTIIGSVQNANVIFKKFNLKGLDITVQDGTKTKPGFKVVLDSSSLLHSIKARVKNKTTTREIDLTLQEALTPFKMTPIDSQDKVTMFCD